MSYDIDKVSVPRLAHLVKGDKGYGFNLHGDKNQPGQTISAVDKDSPAEVGGLREGDKVIEVNHENVENKTHGEVVQLIKKNPGETTLLVCDKDTLAYLKANDRQCTAEMVNLTTVIPSVVPAEPQVIANGSATTEVVQDKIEESAPASVVESSPPPPETVTKADDQEPAPVDTTPEEVKQLNDVLDEQDKPAEQPQPPVQQVEEPAPQVEEQKPQMTESISQSEPDKSFDNSGITLDMNAARPKPKGSKKNLAKSTGEGWGSKVNKINAL